MHKSLHIKNLLSVLLLTCSFLLQAQTRVDVRNDINIRAGSIFYSVGGAPVATREYYELVEGTPFFKDEWLTGLVVLNNGQIIKNIRLKINLVKGTIYYLDQFGLEFIAETSLKEVVLEDTTDNKNYRFVHSSTLLPEGLSKKNNWYLWLVSGKVSLYKKFDKAVYEQRRYGSATLEQRIETKEQYAVYYNDKLVVVKKIKDLPAVLFTHKKGLTELIQSKEITTLTSVDDQFAAVVQHYNLLAK